MSAKVLKYHIRYVVLLYSLISEDIICQILVTALTANSDIWLQTN